jgi:hypothetical protein
MCDFTKYAYKGVAVGQAVDGGVKMLGNTFKLGTVTITQCSPTAFAADGTYDFTNFFGFNGKGTIRASLASQDGESWDYHVAISGSWNFHYSGTVTCQGNGGSCTYTGTVDLGFNKLGVQAVQKPLDGSDGQPSFIYLSVSIEQSVIKMTPFEDNYVLPTVYLEHQWR